VQCDNLELGLSERANAPKGADAKPWVYGPRDLDCQAAEESYSLPVGLQTGKRSH